MHTMHTMQTAQQLSITNFISDPTPTSKATTSKVVHITPGRQVYTPIRKRKTQPIMLKDHQDLIKQELLNSSPKPHLAYRNYLIWLVGCNIGRRARDLLTLRLGDVIDFNTQKVYSTITIIEQKTGKESTFAFAPSVKQAIQELFDTLPSEHKHPWYPLFPSQKQKPKEHTGDIIYAKEKDEKGKCINTGKRQILKKDTTGCLNPRSYNSILSKINKELKLCQCLGTHSMRKTAVRHAYEVAESRKAQTGITGLEVAQTITNHNSSKTTLSYIGITDELLTSIYETELF